MRLLPCPLPGDLRDLPMHRKPDTRGVVAWVVFAFLRTLRWFGIGWATRVYDEFTQVISGRIYWRKREPSKSLRDHESVHDWQARTRGGIRYTLEYAMSRHKRRHFEAMAYALEVVAHGRQQEEAARTASDSVYRCKWSTAEARALIDEYAASLRLRGW